MNLSELQNKLLAAARRNPPDDQVPYAFEKRIMARLTAAPKPSEWLAWSRALWFGAAACVAVALITSVLPLRATDDDDDSFSEGVEQSILASMDDFDSVQ
ncbi:MAG TPA: hypothetical protein VFT34_10195 [Verrucomicrobiae bacterium]|nr:hypothetical protein [Verrucomicrobiae bacterium]